MTTEQRDFARQLRSNLTDSERLLWRHVRLRQLHGHKFRRQYVVSGYIVDFACVERKLVVEVDGGQHAERRAYDTDRTARIEAQGFHVLRFWNNEVLGNIEGVLEVILAALEERPPSRPSP